MEINTREHFTVLGLDKKHYEVRNAWFFNRTDITIYKLEELLGTKLRALYQRKKGRDLFDLTMALKQFPTLKIPQLIACFERYMAFSTSKISRGEFEANLTEKINDEAFTKDISPLLPSTVNLNYDPLVELSHLQDKVIRFLPGEAWKNKEKRAESIRKIKNIDSLMI
jgi:predicted nucleotidyltransferase component of viral defense system